MKVLEISLNRHQDQKKYMRPNDMTILRNNDTATQRQRYNDTTTLRDSDAAIQQYSVTAAQRHSKTSDTAPQRHSDTAIQ